MTLLLSAVNPGSCKKSGSCGYGFGPFGCAVQVRLWLSGLVEDGR